MNPVRFAILGAGFRARAFVAVAAAAPELLEVAAVLPHRPGTADDLAVPVVADISALLATRPAFDSGLIGYTPLVKGHIRSSLMV